MYKYHKKNKKTGTKAHLHKSLIDYSPFDMRDTSYLEHLHKELKLRNARDAMVSLRKDMIESNKRSNYQNEIDRLTNELYRPVQIYHMLQKNICKIELTNSKN